MKVKVHKAGQHVHFIGIGGVGMSGIASILQELGENVSGSDMKPSETLSRLEAKGVVCYTEHKVGNVTGADIVVISSAIPEDNEELKAARVRGIPVLQRAQMLSRLMDRQKGIAVAGAHGKTTTTAMTALILEKNGINPTIVVGGELNDIGGNAKLGSGDWLVAEADESDASFLLLNPHLVVVTNIENDHLDHYGSEENVVKAFSAFLDKVPPDGMAFLCTDDTNIKSLAGVYRGPRITYGTGGNPDYLLRVVSLEGLTTVGEMIYHGEVIGRLKMNVPGRHNLLDACAATAVGLYLGLPFDAIARVLESFKGVHRRFEILGKAGGVMVVDDYAHHPSEVKATLQAAAQLQAKRVIAAFQPHRYSRTYFLSEEFGAAFNDADIVVISDIYSAGEKPIPGVTSRSIIQAVEKVKKNGVVYCPKLSDVFDYLVSEVKAGDLVMTLGAGDIYHVGEKLAARLEKEQAGEK